MPRDSKDPPEACEVGIRAVAVEEAAPRIAVVGLGYVGLPLATAFGRHFPTLGYDLSAEKIAAYRSGRDPSGELAAAEFSAARLVTFSGAPDDLAAADFIVITVPTPVDEAQRPDFGPLLAASEVVGRHLKQGAVVIYESTVYPGATEEVCIPALERTSGRRWKIGFHVAYSPERINPGDAEHSLRSVVKIVAGDTPETLEKVAALYRRIVEAGVHPVSSLQVAEAAKVIENTQRDLNIALMNELAIIFDRLDLDTREVLEAAGTKWNFLPFRPGLVGGHCIGVDPYYLTCKAEMVGYHPQVILAGRRINDGMAKFVAAKTVKTLVATGCSVSRAKVNVLGLTFKENCADIRNSKVADLVAELREFGVDVHLHDPFADAAAVQAAYGLTLTPWDALPVADAIVVAVAHRAYPALEQSALLGKLRPGGCLLDVKACMDAAALRRAGITVWRL